METTLQRPEEYFDTKAVSWNDHYRSDRHFMERIRHLQKMLHGVTLSKADAVDIGCGGGFISILMARSGARVQGVDSATKMVAAAEANARTEGLDIRFVSASATSLPFSDASFDIATCISVLEYVDDTDACLSEIRRILRPGAVAIVSVPNAHSIARKAESIMYRLTRPWRRGEPSYLAFQKHQFTKADFDHQLGKHGLTVVEHAYYVAPIFEAWSAASWMGMMYMVKLKAE